MMQIHYSRDERGIALVLALFLMTALSVLGASLMFLSQTETYASMNYRMMSQARYAAEAGVNKTANFLLDRTPGGYPVPTPAEVAAGYNTTMSPVTVNANGNPVILTAGTWTGMAANYPVAAVQTAFNAAAQGQLTAGTATLTYKAYATLMSMQIFTDRFGVQQVIQTWDITADGGLTGSSKATVRVSATVETPKVSANAMAAFATDNGCGAMTLFGNMSTDSYDSAIGPPAAGPVDCSPGAPPPSAANSSTCEDGDIGTNGNIDISGSADVHGQMYTPRQGVGVCTQGQVTGLTEGGSLNVAGSMVSLPKAMTFPVPPPSAVPGTNTVTVGDNFLNGPPAVTPAQVCTSLGFTLGTTCDLKTSSGGKASAGAAGPYDTLFVNGGGAPVTLPNVSVSKNFNLVITGASPGQTVNINSLSGKGNISFDYADNTQMITLNVAGKMPDGSEMTTPFDLGDLDSTWKQNKPPGGTTWDASALQIVYAGTQAITMQGGNSQSAVTIYAPNAAFTLKGTQDLFGSILAKKVTDGGNAGIHYDRRLSRDFWIVGQPMMGTFSWQRAQ